MPKRPEMSEEEIHALIEKDPTSALFYFLDQAGATMTLYGVPVQEEQLRSEVSASVDERIDLAICSAIKDKMTAEEKLQKLLDQCAAVIPYVLATLPYDNAELTRNNVKCTDNEYVAIHGGRAISSTRQLSGLMKLVNEFNK